MNEDELKAWTKAFALRVMRLVDALPSSVSGRAIASQLVRAGMSVGANYRAACRGRSKAEFAAKLGVCVEEADECGFWLELIGDGALLPEAKLTELRQEAHELTAIFVASIRTTRGLSSSNRKSSIESQKSDIESHQ